MSYEDQLFSKQERFWTLKTIIYVGIFVIVVAGIGLFSNVASLLWLPQRQAMETSITRNSPGFVQARQTELRSMMVAYTEAADAGHKAMILKQMRMLADSIDGYVPDDVSDLLKSTAR